MGWIKRMSLKKALFTMMFLGLLLASMLSIGVFYACTRFNRTIAPNGIIIDSITSPPSIITQPDPSAQAVLATDIISILQIVLPILIFTIVILITSILFYRMKLEGPLYLLKNGAERIMQNDLDFVIPAQPDVDELGQLCNAFEKMRKNLLVNNQTLWRQAEERKRLNAAFAHDLRNPLTVLKGTVKLLRKGVLDEPTLSRMESYTRRIEQYIDSMSSIQKLEQMSVQKQSIPCSQLYSEIADTVNLLAPSLSYELSQADINAADLRTVNINAVNVRTGNIKTADMETVEIDPGLFMIVAENLVANAARFAEERLWIHFDVKDSFLLLSVMDDGPGYPGELIQNGPKPFGRLEESGEHFGMGLYSCQIICLKHGGKLVLENVKDKGAKATAFFCI